MTTAYAITRDSNSYPSTGSFTCMIPTDTAYQVILTANTIATVTVPPAANTNRLMAKFTYAIATGNPVVWASPNSAVSLVLPTTTATSVISELNPVAWEVKVGQAMQFLTAETGVNMSVTYYALPNTNQ